MSSQGILIIFLVFFVLEFSFNMVLTLLNLREVKRNSNKIPYDFNSYIDEETYGKSVNYTIDKGKFSLYSGTFHSLVILVMVLTGFFGKVDTFIAGFKFHVYLEGILYVGVLSLLFYFLDMPFTLYSNFFLEKKYGFNKLTPCLFVKDQIKSLIISGLLLSIVLIGVFYFMDRSGNLWWILASAIFILFQLLLSVLYPLLIAPLFNKFTPLQEGDLKSTLEKLASDNDFKTKGIYVMDGSKRSSHSNAYFTGFGKFKRIVLFDTLVSILTPPQLAGVLAHEIGHEKKHHLLKGLLLSFFITVTAFFIIDLFLGYFPLFKAFGFSRISYHGIIVILSFCSGPFTFFLIPLFTMWSRKHEYEADRYAVKATGSKKDLKEGLIILTKENLSNLTPHPLYSFFHYSHPTIGERIRAIEEIP